MSHPSCWVLGGSQHRITGARAGQTILGILRRTASGTNKLTPMRIVPVLDILAGVVVRAVGGRRADYRPLVSQLTTTTDPLGVARAIRERFRLDELYIADLDAIGGAEPRWDIFESLRDDGFRLWVDAGVRNESDIRRVAPFVDRVIIGSETLEQMPTSAEWPCIAFSLDLRDGRALGRYGIADAMAAGIGHILVIDLAHVGIARGVGTESIVAQLVRDHPGVEVYVGGGVRDSDDIARLKRLGITGVLVASALHDGHINGEPGA